MKKEKDVKEALIFDAVLRLTCRFQERGVTVTGCWQSLKAALPNLERNCKVEERLIENSMYSPVTDEDLSCASTFGGSH